jgi:carboxymethylenebutenolidase
VILAKSNFLPGIVKDRRHTHAQNRHMGDHIEIELPGSAPLDAYIARPSGEATGAVIVGMELFGVNEHIRDVTDRFARAGHIAIAPNFYHRTLPRSSLPFGDAGRTEGFRHLHQLRRDDALADVAAVLAYLGVSATFVGFSFGGHIAYLAATQFALRATACFYGGWITTTEIPLGQPTPTLALTPHIRGKLIYFAGGRDPVITRDQLDAIDDALTRAAIPHELVVYPDATHGFFCDQRDTFDRAARDDSWQRVIALISAGSASPVAISDTGRSPPSS